MSVKANPLGENSHLIYPYFYIILRVFFFKPVLISELCTTSAKAVEACI